MSDTKIQVSIVIVSWNTCEITCECIRSIFKQTKDIHFEIIVVDNGSSDNSVEILHKYFPTISIIENENNVGFASANNQGIAISKGDYILLLNSDTIILDNAIKKVIEFASENNIGLTGCKLLNKDMSLQSSCFKYPSIINMIISTFYLNTLFPHHRFFGRERMSWWQHEEIKEVDTVVGAFMLIDKKAINDCEGMDDNFFFYAEEMDLCFRLKKAGWKIVYTPITNIIHLGGQSSKQIKPAMILQLRSGVLQFVNKHHSFFYYFICCLLTSLWFSLRIIPWLVIAFYKPSQFNYSILMAKTYCLGAIKSLFGYKALEFKRH